MTISIRSTSMRALLHNHFLVKVIGFFSEEPIIILSEVARLFPQLVHLCIFRLRDRPDALALSFVPFPVLLYALFYLLLV